VLGGRAYLGVEQSQPDPDESLVLSESVRRALPRESIIDSVSGFSAVVTTGIYCRPGCGARPHERNVRSFPTAAAAEAAGYRACLRCRPYRSAPSISWSGPELVCRAVQLVLDGGLDDGSTEHDLGAKLGISARHLRRLFAAHVGATPDQLARSRPAHFARRLLDDTDLTVAEIAFASGFGSVRQLNRASHEVFRAAPRELRARRRAADRLAADGGLVLRLPFEPPLDWETMLSYFRARAIAGVEDVSDGTYRRTVAIDGDPGVIELSRGSREHLRLQVHLPHWEGLIHHVQRARRIFNLDADAVDVLAQLGADPLLGPLVQAHRGLRPPGAWDPFEIGVRAIVGQQVSVAAANGIIARLVARIGKAVPGLGQLRLTHLFPAPSDLAEAELGRLGLTRARARAVAAFARAVADGHIDLDRSRTLEELTDSITATVGLGPWTAHYLALRLGEPDAFPAGDLGLQRALGQRTGHSVSTREADELAERWRPHRACAAAQLWLA
jgi:AraC family transcriptional regulator of adaptative response / DNA-3-methyladenine glycosylase II